MSKLHLRMKKLLIVLLLTSTAWAQNADRKFVSQKKTGNTFEITTSDGKYQIQFYNPEIVETTFIPNGEKFNPESHAVVLKPTAVKITRKETAQSIDLQTTGISINIQKSPFKIGYNYNGAELLSEKNGYVKSDQSESIDFNISQSEALYGGGARALGLNRRGHRLQLYNRADYGYTTRSELMNYTLPLVLSSKIYAVHFDNAPIGYLDLDSKKDNTLVYETISGRKTYQVIAAKSWTNLVENYTALTGKQPLPPLWAFGNLSSRFGYKNQEQVEKTIKKFEEDQIPVDGIILDLYWFGKTIQGTMGNLDWDKDNFPNPDKMLADLNAKNIKTVLITEPFVLTTSSKWKEATDKKVIATGKDGKPFVYDFYFGNTGIIDIFKPEGKDWFWNIYKNLSKKGVAGWWGDLGEPEVFPSEVITAKGTADEVHNIYGHNWAKLVFEGYKKDLPEQRPFILMRSGYSGSQRYGMLPWSGDVSRSWGGLQSQPEIALEMGMQGIGYMHSDLGGFAGDYYDNELYIRWLQYGVFQPIFRPHAQDDVASEPVYKDVLTKAKAKKQVELRYQLLPYIYTLAFENNQKGTPLMRPLLFEEPQNEKLFGVSDAYFWGNDFLVKPIMEAGLATTSVYFPKSSNWYDFNTNKKYIGGTTESVTVNEDHIPVFVRGGAFIPMIKTIQNTAAYSLKQFDLHYYFDDKTTASKGKIYNDDGKTPDAFEKGKYEILHLESRFQANQLIIKISPESGKSFAPRTKNINLVLHHVKARSAVRVNGKITTFKASNNMIEIPLTIETGKSQEIKILL